jgi:ABC-type glycerol-3-phosphate transport system substrate-binding protein
MLMHKKLLTTALLVVLPFFVTACSLKELPVIGKFFGGSPAINKSATINVWGLWEDVQVMDALINKYKEKNPSASVVYDNRSIQKSDQYRDTLYTRLSQEGAAGSDVGDVVVIHESWVPKMKAYLSPAPGSFMDAKTYTSSFYPSATENAVLDGKIYAYPVYYDGLALVYNKKHFAEIDQETPPTAWEEFRRLALKLTQKDQSGNLVRGGAAIGASKNIDFFSDIVGLLLAQAGVSVPSGLTTEDAKDALTFYTNFVNEDGVWDEDMPEASTAFAQEKVSMIFIPSWNLLDIIRVRPDLDIGVAPVPQAVPESPVSWASFWMYAVPEKSKNKDVAWDFIKFLSTEEAQLLMFSTASQYRTYGAPYSLAALRDQVSSGPAAEYIKPYLDTAPFSKGGMFAARVGNTNTVSALKDAISSAIASVGRVPIPEMLKALKEKLGGSTSGDTSGSQ